MERGVILWLYIIACIIGVANILTHYRKVKRIDGFLCFNIAYTIYYFIMPLMNIVIINLGIYQVGSFTDIINRAYDISLLKGFLISIVAYSVFCIIYSVAQPYSKTKVNSYAELIDTTNNQKQYKIVITFGWIALLLGASSEMIIISSFGGIVNAISMAEILRAYGADRSQFMSQNLLFVNILATISLVAPFAFLFARRIKSNSLNFLLLAVSLLCSVFYLLFFAGKLPVLLFVICFIADYIYRKHRHPTFILSCCAVGLLPTLSGLDKLFFYISYGTIKDSSTNWVTSLVNEFSFPYCNLINAQYINELFGYRYGMDYFTWIINIVPTAILRIFGLSKVNSSFEFISKFYDPTGVTMGGVPTDFLTMGYRQFNIIGIFFQVVIVAVICSLLDNILKYLNPDKYMFLIVRISLIMFVIIPYNDLDSFVRNRFDMIMVVLIAFAVTRIYVKKDSRISNEYVNKRIDH